MDFELKNNCNNCKGLNNCNTYCAMHAGKAVVDFLSRVDMIETKIGEYRSRVKNGEQDLIVHGHQLYDLTTPSWLLTDIDITLDASSKFSNVFGKTPLQLVNSYCNKAGITTDETKELVDKLTKLNKNKLIVLPIKPHTPCSINIDGDGSNNIKEGKVAYLKWVTDRETYKLKCEVAFELNNDSSKKLHKLPIVEYITNFRLSSLELQAKSSGHDDRLIKMTDYGIIKPIEIKSGNITIAVDGNYVYSVINGDIRIVGYWDETDKLVLPSDSNSKVYKKIKDNMNFIKNHKKYIAPYLLFEANTIEL